VVEGKLVPTLRLDAALQVVEPGQTIHLLSGVYTEPFEITGKRASFRRPIVVRGDSGATFDGRRNLVRPPHGESIGRDHYAFVKIVDSEGIVLENVTIQNVWPTAIFIGDSSEVVLRRLNLHGGTYAIFARGAKARKIVAERCAWTGDVALWDGVLWKDAHAPPFPRRELDGDFFRSVDIGGEVVVRHNMIQHVFNGVHLFATSNKGVTLDNDPVNRDVWVYENTFAFVRDNVVEAEGYARNWWIFGNRVYNGHKWFAFEDAAGGYWYLFANVGWFDRRPGPPGDPNVGGAVFKKSGKALPDEPVYVFHNTWYLRSTYIKEGRLPNLFHFNNAILYARAADHPPGLVDDNKPMFGADYLDAWEAGDAIFDHDYCHHPHYAAMARRSGGTPAPGGPEPGFQDRENSEFTPSAGSPLLMAGKNRAIRLADRTPWNVPAWLHLGAVKEWDDREFRDRTYSPGELGCPANGGRPGPSWATPGASPAFPP
jgi:hypothetical protein